jgi:uncharacterized membrane protein
MNTGAQLIHRSISRSTSIRAALVAMLALASAVALVLVSMLTSAVALADQPPAPAASLAAKISPRAALRPCFPSPGRQ